ncbi:MAG: diguanylate cyclase (GGDEF)-like protein [Cellvibrionaceae bacterium]|jgi:diguanylate cyclase (GGDEF)-like protein
MNISIKKYIRYTSPLANRLMRTVFGIYLLIAISLTTVQMFMQYLNEERRLNLQMKHMAVTFAPILARAMWEFNEEQLQATMLGLLVNPEIIGISIVDIDGHMISMGSVNSQQKTDVTEDITAVARGNLYVFDFDIDITFEHADVNLQPLGRASLYSSKAVVATRVWDTLLITFVGACFKTLCLWLIFSIALKKLVANPLDKLSVLIKAFNPTNNSPCVSVSEKNKKLMPLTSQDELNTLEKNFLTMTAKISLQQQELQRHHDNLNSIFEALPDIYFRLNHSGVILDYKVQNTDDFYTVPTSFMGKKMIDVLPEEVSVIFSDHFDRYLRAQEQNAWEYNLVIDGQQKVFEARLRTIENREEFILLIRNVTENKAAAELIWYQANMDELTTLPNRNMLHHRLNMEIEKSKRTALPLAVLFLDLDQFKGVNDTLGHDIGDILLKETASRIKDCVREIDFVGRQGGDEFTIILSELSQLDVVETISNRILSELSKPFRLGVDVAYISASIGITLYPFNAETVSDLLKTADQAMYAAKAQGRNCFNYFTESMQEHALARMRLANDLRIAIKEEQFQLYYQPIISLQDGRICKAEALIRWHHPTRGLILPSNFIALAEETHMIVDIGNWVFVKAVHSVPMLREVYGEDFQLSVNISPVQFASNESSAEHWLDCLNAEGLSGNAIIGEITEGLLMEANDETAKKLMVFAEKNIQISIDDFGTGYSSLSYLKKYDIDYLKIDQCFVKNLTTDSDDYALCEAIIVMAHKLGIKVVAEGIETEEQYQLLRSAGCDFGQGYFISKPIELAFMLDESANHHIALVENIHP